MSNRKTQRISANGASKTDATKKSTEVFIIHANNVIKMNYIKEDSKKAKILQIVYELYKAATIEILAASSPLSKPSSQYIILNSKIKKCKME